MNGIVIKLKKRNVKKNSAVKKDIIKTNIGNKQDIVVKETQTFEKCYYPTNNAFVLTKRLRLKQILMKFFGLKLYERNNKKYIKYR